MSDDRPISVRECDIKHEALEREVAEMKERLERTESCRQEDRKYFDGRMLTIAGTAIIILITVVLDILFRPGAKEIAAQVSSTIVKGAP